MGNTRDIPRKARSVPRLTALALALALVALAAGRAHAACPSLNDLVVGDRSGSFVQTRRLVGFDAPLISEGMFRLSGDRLDWHVQEPFDVRTIIGPDGITQALDGGEPAPVEAGTTAVVAPITGALAALLRADFAALRRSFTITTAEAGHSGGWSATLAPLNEDLRAVVGTIDVEGCDAVDHVTLRRPSGDTDRIDLYPVSSTGQAGDASAR